MALQVKKKVRFANEDREKRKRGRGFFCFD